MLSREKSLNENKEEYQYLDLIQQILEHGTTEVGRNGTTKSIFGNCMRFFNMEKYLF